MLRRTGRHDIVPVPDGSNGIVVPYGEYGQQIDQGRQTATRSEEFDGGTGSAGDGRRWTRF